MKVEFLIPPASQRVGGIDLAIEGMRSSLGERHEISTREAGVPDEATELVHFHGLWQPQHLAAYRACVRRGLPYIVSPHGMLEPWAYRHRRWKKWPWLRLFENRHLRNASAVLATSSMEAENLQPFTPNDSIRIAPLGLDEEMPVTRDAARREFDIGPDTQILLYLSRIDRKKGLDLLFESLAETPTKNLELWIVGDGDEGFLGELKQFARERAADLPAVRWCGAAWGDARWRYLLAADLFCLPTHSENFGFAILEALWVGTRTLTTDRTPWAEHRIEGLSICGDNTGSLCAALGELQRDPIWDSERRSSLREWARAKFHWQHLGATYDRIYREAAGAAANTYKAA